VGLAFSTGAASGAAATTQPSDRGCLVAWNAPANQVNRAKLLAARPKNRLALRGGRSSTDTWAKGNGATATSTQACLLTLWRPRTAQVVIGVWRDGRVMRWSWGSVTPPTPYLSANVKLLPDGRVTKIYRR
jgi:hypothetical protein